MPTLSQPNTETQPRLETLVQTVRFLHAQGWTPATSSNFSLRSSEKAGFEGFLISVSGLDKGQLTPADFLPVDETGNVTDTEKAHIKPSAETLLHGWVYKNFPQAGVVLHTHSVNGTVVGKLHQKQGVLTFTDFEILKGLEGIKTHEAEVTIPVLPNHQDMGVLVKQLDDWYQQNKNRPLYGFLLAGHGLYSWGETPAQAQRHIEVFEFLFDCLIKLKSVEGK